MAGLTRSSHRRRLTPRCQTHKRRGASGVLFLDVWPVGWLPETQVGEWSWARGEETLLKLNTCPRPKVCFLASQSERHCRKGWAGASAGGRQDGNQLDWAYSVNGGSHKVVQLICFLRFSPGLQVLKSFRPYNSSKTQRHMAWLLGEKKFFSTFPGSSGWSNN